MAASLKMTNGKPPMCISYPFNEYAHKQVANAKQAIAVQKSHEQRVICEGIVDDYNAEMEKAIQAGNIIELTKEEMNSWTGGVHYITHFPIIKMSSASTKVQIVSDSKM